MLGLGTHIVSDSKKFDIEDLGIVRDNLVLDHSNYHAEPVTQVSTGAAALNIASDTNERITTSSSVDIGTNDVTMCAWVHATTLDNNMGVVCNRTNSGNKDGVLIQLLNTGAFKLTLDRGAGVVTTNGTSTNKTLNQWCHVCGVWDRSDKQHLYVNGVLEASTDISSYETTDLDPTANNIKIGHSHNNIDFRGYMCNVGYWDDRVLSQAEIRSIMWKNYSQLDASEKGTELVSWWNLDEETNTSGGAGTGGVKDYHGSNHGTLS